MLGEVQEMRYGNYFGHVHSGPTSSGKDSDRLVNLFPYQYDVGVDNNNYTPVSWDQIKTIMDNKIKWIEPGQTIHDETFQI